MANEYIENLVNKAKDHPYSPCNDRTCPVAACCNIIEQLFKCQMVRDFLNAFDHKNSGYITIYYINEYGVWRPFMSGSAKTHTTEHLFVRAMEHYIFDEPLDFDKNVEYTKYLENLPYYDKL